MKAFGFYRNATLILLGWAISLSSIALPVAGRSIIYLDAQNNIIGQQVLYCNNVSKHAGNVSESNPYRIEEEYGCGDRTLECKGSLESNGEHDKVYVFNCNRSGSNNYSTIVYFNSGTGSTTAQYCQSTSGLTGPFAAHPTCGLPAPSEIPGFPFPYLRGWNP